MQFGAAAWVLARTSPSSGPGQRAFEGRIWDKYLAACYSALAARRD